MLNPTQIIQFQQAGITQKKLGNIYHRTERTIRRWKKGKEQPLQKRGRKFKFNKFICWLLYDYLATRKNRTTTQKQMAEHLTKQTRQKISQSTICRILQKDEFTYKKITYHYSEQIARLKDIKASTDFLKSLPLTNILALDECSFRLNEAPRYGYFWKGMRANHGRPGKRGLRYTLILCIRNVNGKGVIHWELIEKGANAQNLHDFIKGIVLPTGEKYYLLLDNARIHHAVKSCRKLKLPTVKEHLLAKNIEPIFLVPYTPQLNPVELCFNIIRKHVEKCQPRNEEELRRVISKIIDMLNQKDLTSFFRHCMDYDLIEKNYKEKGSNSRAKSGHELWIE